MKKKKSLLWRITRGLILLGVFILIGSGTAAGIQVYNDELKLYTDRAYTYVRLTQDFVEPQMIRFFIEEREDFEAAFNDPDYYKKYGEDGEMIPFIKYWYEIGFDIISTKRLHDDIRYVYIVIPEEDGFLYLWDSNTSGENPSTPPYTFEAYRPGEKEMVTKILEGKAEGNELLVGVRNNEMLGTAMAPLEDENGEIVALSVVDVSMAGITDSISRIILNIAAVLGIIIAAGCVVYYLVLRKKTVEPLLELKGAASRLVDQLEKENDEPVKIDIHTGDEIEEVANAFDEMQHKLKDFIREKEAATAEKERFATEMELAGRIQSGMLPDIDSSAIAREEIELFASMEPAKAVGGDFYDVFPVDEAHIVFVMADVSGKGVPAALFMMMCKIVIRDQTKPGLRPSEILDKVNTLIYENNPSGMFVTVWLGILDLRTGVLEAGNAGHEYPVIRHPDGTVELYKDKHSFVVGTVEGIKYKEYELVLEPGTGLFLYTDGVPEATNSEHKKLGNDRMVAALQDALSDSPQEAVRKMDRAVKDFVRDAEQFDDITMMYVIYKG